LHLLDLFDGLHVTVLSAPKMRTIGCLSNQRVHSRFLMYGSATVIQVTLAFLSSCLHGTPKLHFLVD
jgi:hypothetical protein